ncbi:DNA helicase [Stenotrophomonas phage Silvanus]|nr:DNA helicase [Stenotrophomonas phage Silvanus]
MARLRGFQQEVQRGVFDAWAAGHRVVMPVCPTGAGKTVIMGDSARYNPGHGIAAAHRSELVGQISLSLAKVGLQHNIMAPRKIVKLIGEQHMDELGAMFVNSRAKWHVASVDTLIKRDVSAWSHLITMGFMDEGHHVLENNKWGRAVNLFPNAYWMLPTATPCRADGRGLGRHASGLVDAMIVGPTMRQLIDWGYLCPYRIRAPLPSDLDISSVEISSATGDYNVDQLRAAVKRSNKIVGDVVDTYAKNTPNMLGIVFAVDVEHAKKITDEFNRRGFAAAVITADDDPDTRRRLLKAFARRELKVLVNVDLFGEGFDLPAIEVVMFARPTASFSLYAQQFGRALRLMISRILAETWDDYPDWQRKKFIAESEKPIAYIHDHVGNLLHFNGPPDMPRAWTLDDVERRSRPSDAIPLRVCVSELCQQPYLRTEPCCPWCGTVPPPPVAPKGPQEVDGDITLYTPEMLAAMFEKIEEIHTEPVVYGNGVVANSIKKNHRERKEIHQNLASLLRFIMQSADPQRAMREFYYRYNVDMLTAQTLPGPEAEALRQRILDHMATTTIQ